MGKVKNHLMEIQEEILDHLHWHSNVSVFELIRSVTVETDKETIVLAINLLVELKEIRKREMLYSLVLPQVNS